MKNYSIDTVNVSFNGFLITKGLKSVSIAQENDLFDYDVGTGGEVVRIRKIDFRAKVTVTLMGSSSDNAILSGFHTADGRLPNGGGAGILYISQGNDIFIAEKAWIVKAPDRTFEVDAAPGDCEWVFACADLRRVDAGLSDE